MKKYNSTLKCKVKNLEDSKLDIITFKEGFKKQLNKDAYNKL